MKILYVSSAASKKQFEYMQERINLNNIDNIYGMPEASYKFHNTIINGLVNNNCEVYSVIGRPVSIKTHNKLFWPARIEKEKNITYNHMFILGIPFLKQLICFFELLFIAFYWLLKNITSKDKVIIIDAAYVTLIPAINLITAIIPCKKISIVSDVYSYMADVDDANKTRNIKTKIMSFATNIWYKKLNGFIFLSDNMHKLEPFSQRPYIVMEAIIDGNKDVNNVKKEDYIMYAGTIRKEYGVERLVQSFSNYKNDNVELWIFGNGPYVDELKQVEKKDKRIKYKGKVSLKEIMKYESEALLLINPRFTNEEFTKYSFPSKIVEYMLSSTPLLTSKLPSMPNDYYKYVYTIDDDSNEALTKALKKILSNSKEELNEFGKKAHDFIVSKKNNIVQSKRIKEFITNNVKKPDVVSCLCNLLIFISTFLIIIGALNSSVSVGKIGLLICYFSILIKCIKQYKKYLMMILFLISFFTFGLGQYIFPNVTNDNLYYQNFSDKYVSITILIQYISLISMYFGYYLIDNTKTKNRSVDLNKNYINKSTRGLFLVYIISFVCSIATNLEAAYYTIKYGYLYLYAESGSYASALPYFVTKFGSYLFIFLSLYLAVCKNKRNTIIALALYFINSITSLLVGGRFDFIFAICLIVFVYIYSNIRNNSNNPRIIKKIIIPCVIIVPILLIAMNIYNTTRNKKSITSFNPLYEIEAFFVSQGRSANLITYSQMYASELKGDNKFYIFGTYYESINEKTCKISSDLCDKNIDKNNINYGYAISNIVLGKSTVKNGHGLGSQYLAELLLEGGIILIIIYNIFFGALIAYFHKSSANNIIAYVFMMNLLKPVLHISRGMSFELFAPFTSIAIWTIIIIYIICNYSYKKICNKKGALNN